MELFAERGVRGSTLQAVAERADVSPGLVQHHYKTKERLLSEVQAWVLERLTDVPAGAASSLKRGREPARYEQSFLTNPVVAAYLRRSLLDSELTGIVEWFHDALANCRARMATNDSDSADRDIRAAMTFLIDLAPILLGPLLEHALECDAAALRSRWQEVEIALLGLAVRQTD